MHRDGGPLTGADLVERVPGEVVAHDRLVAEFVECLPHAVEIPLRFFLRGVSGPVEKLAGLLWSEPVI